MASVLGRKRGLDDGKPVGKDAKGDEAVATQLPAQRIKVDSFCCINPLIGTCRRQSMIKNSLTPGTELKCYTNETQCKASCGLSNAVQQRHLAPFLEEQQLVEMRHFLNMKQMRLPDTAVLLKQLIATHTEGLYSNAENIYKFLRHKDKPVAWDDLGLSLVVEDIIRFVFQTAGRLVDVDIEETETKEFSYLEELLFFVLKPPTDENGNVLPQHKSMWIYRSTLAQRLYLNQMKYLRFHLMPIVFHYRYAFVNDNVWYNYHAAFHTDVVIRGQKYSDNIAYHKTDLVFTEFDLYRNEREDIKWDDMNIINGVYFISQVSKLELVNSDIMLHLLGVYSFEYGFPVLPVLERIQRRDPSILKRFADLYARDFNEMWLSITANTQSLGGDANLYNRLLVARIRNIYKTLIPLLPNKSNESKALDIYLQTIQVESERTFGKSVEAQAIIEDMIQHNTKPVFETEEEASGFIVMLTSVNNNFFGRYAKLNPAVWQIDFYVSDQLFAVREIISAIMSRFPSIAMNLMLLRYLLYRDTNFMTILLIQEVFAWTATQNLSKQWIRSLFMEVDKDVKYNTTPKRLLEFARQFYEGKDDYDDDNNNLYPAMNNIETLRLFPYKVMHLPWSIGNEFYLYNARRSGIVYSMLTKMFDVGEQRNRQHDGNDLKLLMTRAYLYARNLAGVWLVDPYQQIQFFIMDSYREDNVSPSAEISFNDYARNFDQPQITQERLLLTQERLLKEEKLLKEERLLKEEGLQVMNRQDVKDVQAVLDSEAKARFNLGLLGEIPQNAAAAALDMVLQPQQQPQQQQQVQPQQQAQPQQAQQVQPIARDTVDLTLDDDDDDKTGGYQLKKQTFRVVQLLHHKF